MISLVAITVIVTSSGVNNESELGNNVCVV